MGVVCVDKKWKQRYILERITMTTWSLTGTPTSRRSRHCSTSRRNRSWRRSTRSSTSPQSNGKLLRGWDLLCFMTEKPSQKQRYTSIQIQFFVWERCTDIQMPWWSGQNNSIFQESNEYRELFHFSSPVRVEYFPRTHHSGNSARD